MADFSKSEKEIRKLPMEVWCKLAREGTDIPVTTCLGGYSMEPLIRIGKDPVTIIPLKRQPIPGDIVLFERADGAYVVHRLYRIIDNEMVQTWGDNCSTPDAPIKRSDVLGLAISYERDGRSYNLDNDIQREKGLAWLESKWRRPAFILYRKAQVKLGLIIKRHTWER